jgi:hypothetical protein
VGQAPGRRNGRGAPFEGPCARRLAGLAGLEERELRRRVRLVNLLGRWPGPSASKGDAFPIARAREAARRFPLRGRVLLAGRGVARAFGVDAPFLEWVELGRARVAVFPHPSGVSHWWNDPANARRAAEFLAEAAS